MSAPTRPALTPRFARTLSEVHLAIWAVIAGGIITMMCWSGGPGGLGGVLFLAIIFAFLGGPGIVGALLGRQRAQVAYRALSHGDTARVAREVRASLLINLVFGVGQLGLFTVSFWMLTKLHH